MSDNDRTFSVSNIQISEKICLNGGKIEFCFYHEGTLYHLVGTIDKIEKVEK